MASFGTVQTHVYASRANIPLAGATVVVSRRLPNGQRELIASQRTDSSGNTPPITVETPDLSNSQSPGQGTAFTYIDISADLPLYEQVEIHDVQVFPGILTLQEVQMLPLDTLSTRPADIQQFSVTPQNL